MSVWVQVYRVTWVLTIVVVLFGVICIFVPQYAKYREMQQKEFQMKQEIAAQEAALKNYQMLQSKFPSDPRYVERVARETGRVMSNEAICRLVTNAAPAVVRETNQAQPMPAAPAPRSKPVRLRMNQ